jgi:N-acetylglutamate synthase-like GNAT family acetyltransferase
MSHGLSALPLAPWERDAVAAALRKAGLPSDDLQAHGRMFWRFEEKDVPVGFGGIELHGDAALLHSVVTLPPLRHRGLGGAIAAHLEDEARAHKCGALYLLTVDEAVFFARLGYEICDRANLPAAIRTSPLFAAPGMDTATVMMKRL